MALLFKMRKVGERYVVFFFFYRKKERYVVIITITNQQIDEIWKHMLYICSVYSDREKN